MSATVILIHYGKITNMYTVNNIKVHLSQLAYVSVSQEGNTYNVVMAVKDDCYLTTLSTGNVGAITKGLA